MFSPLALEEGDLHHGRRLCYFSVLIRICSLLYHHRTSHCRSHIVYSPGRHYFRVTLSCVHIVVSSFHTLHQYPLDYDTVLLYPLMIYPHDLGMLSALTSPTVLYLSYHSLSFIVLCFFGFVPTLFYTCYPCASVPIDCLADCLLQFYHIIIAHLRLLFVLQYVVVRINLHNRTQSIKI